MSMGVFVNGLSEKWSNKNHAWHDLAGLSLAR